jgi:hypothetical protein
VNKTIILPIVSALAIFVKSVTGYEVGGEVQNAIVDIVLGGVTIWGIYKNHKTV